MSTDHRHGGEPISPQSRSGEEGTSSNPASRSSSDTVPCEATDSTIEAATETESTSDALGVEVVSIDSTLTSSPQVRKSIWPALALIMIVISGLVGWRALTLWQDSAEQPSTLSEAPAANPKLSVRVAEAVTAPIQGWVTSDGQVQATRGKHLLFEASGEITYLAKIDGRDLREGDFVGAGQLLATIDDRTYQSDIRAAQAQLVVAQETKSQTEAMLAQAQSNLRAAESDLALAQVEYERRVALYDVELAQAQANLVSAESDLNLAQSEYKRRQELFEEGAIPESEVDVYSNQVNQAQAALEVTQQALTKTETAASSEIDVYQNRVDQAEANLQVARESVNSAEDDVRTAVAGVEVEAARLNNAEVAQEDTELVAPIDGVVAYLNIREGDYWTTQRVQGGTDYQSVVESVPIIIVDPNELEVVVEFPAFEGSQLSPGQTAYIVPDELMSQASVSGLTNQTLLNLATAEGTLFSVNPAVTPGGRATEVRIKITEGVDNLRVGANVSVWIEAQTNPNATVIPLGTVVFRERIPYIFVVDPKTQTVEQRQVEGGIEGLNVIEVRSGIDPGELVVTEGGNRLVVGAAVEIVDSVSSGGLDLADEVN